MNAAMEDFVKLLQDKSPQDVRQELRKGKFFTTPMGGISKGYKQANLMAVHKDFADSLERYCHINSGPMALLYSSKPGQFDIPAFSTDSDVRTDLSAYNVFINGELSECLPDLLKFGDQLDDFCFFYLGCSFSFEDALLSGGVPLRHLEQKLMDVPSYKSSIECHRYGVFGGNQVVSMRPVPRELVETCYQITHPLADVHGAPMHIGDPAVIGIDIEKNNFGAGVTMKEGDIPVFWPCGVTAGETLKHAKLPLGFTHRPGCMLITDTAQTTDNGDSTPPPGDLPRVVWLADTPPLASVASQETLEKIKQLEEAAVEDIGKRGIESLLVPDDLLKAALSLSHASSVAITTGFPICLEGDNVYETDGPPGAIALATMMRALGKDVVIVVDDEAGLVSLMRTLLDKLVEKGVLHEAVPVECYPPKGQPACEESAFAFLTSRDGESPRFDHLVAIERAGKARDDCYHSANGSDKSGRIGATDLLFEIARSIPHVFTTGIGDGGNEVGMGKVEERVAKHIPKGSLIACQTATDYLICAGVSNWGGYALAVALALLRLCPIHDRYRRRAIGLPPNDDVVQQVLSASPSVDKEEKVLQTMVDLGFKDATGDVTMAVDWLPFHDVHADKIMQISSIVTSR